MEDKYQKISSDLLEYLNDVTIAITQDQLGSEVFHYEASSKLIDECGTGSDTTKEVAFLKAQSELIERLIINIKRGMTTSKTTSNGFAAHTSLERAKRSALSELLERDLFLTSWFSGHYPSWNIKDINLLDLSFLNSNIDLFQQRDLGLKIGYIGRCGDYHCLVAVLFDLKERFGGIFAAVADQDMNSALKKVIIDQRRMATYILNSINSNLPIYREDSHLIKPSDHQNHYLNLKRKDFINDYINTSREPIELSPIKTNYTIFELPEAISNSINVVQCRSEEVQDYFIGAEIESNINISRIKEVGELVTSRRIHPFG